MHVQPGNSLVTPLQCNCCWFKNLEGSRADLESYSDIQILGYTLREILELFWSREKVTVANVLINVNKGQHMGKLLNVKPIEPTRGPWPRRDMQGFQVAIKML